MATETMDEFMMIINDCYPVSAYKKHYLTARCVLNEAKKLEPANDDDVEKAMWICALLDDLKQVPVGRFEHTFEYKDISFDSAEFIREAFPQKELLDTMYRDGYSPEQIIHAAHRKIIRDHEAREAAKREAAEANDIPEVKITSKVVIKK